MSWCPRGPTCPEGDGDIVPPKCQGEVNPVGRGCFSCLAAVASGRPRGVFDPGECRFLISAAGKTAHNAWTGVPNPVSGQHLRDSRQDRESTSEHRRYAPPPRQAVEDHVDDSWRSDDLAGRARRGASEGVFLDRSWWRRSAAMRGRGRAPGFRRLRGPRRSTDMPLSARRVRR